MQNSSGGVFHFRNEIGQIRRRVLALEYHSPCKYLAYLPACSSAFSRVTVITLVALAQQEMKEKVLASRPVYKRPYENRRGC